MIHVNGVARGDCLGILAGLDLNRLSLPTAGMAGRHPTC